MHFLQRSKIISQNEAKLIEALVYFCPQNWSVLSCSSNCWQSDYYILRLNFSSQIEVDMDCAICFVIKWQCRDKTTWYLIYSTIPRNGSLDEPRWIVDLCITRKDRMPDGLIPLYLNELSEKHWRIFRMNCSLLIGIHNLSYFISLKKDWRIFSRKETIFRCQKFGWKRNQFVHNFPKMNISHEKWLLINEKKARTNESRLISVQKNDFSRQNKMLK